MFTHLKRPQLALLLCFLLLLFTSKSGLTAEPPRYVGSGDCGRCHQQQAADFKNSDHDLAMQPATAKTVLGNFNNQTFTSNGVQSRFYLKDGQFMVQTDDENGQLHDYPITYTFGVYPLQQYLIPMSGGRLQALGIAWDSRDKSQGGQRWFHLYPGQHITHSSPLHWTKPAQNWNFMCAECHSTHLDKNYDAKTQRYNTHWAAVNVACEACHGPASNHLKWAEKTPGWQQMANMGLVQRLDETHGVSWQMDNKTGQPVRSQPNRSRKELAVCAGCHSRRAQFFEDDRQGQPLMTSFLPALLDAGNYHADGQIEGEVYVYGSFIQSRMYQAGVTCTDCHNPHSLKLKLPGNAVCLQCHKASRYDGPQHSFHPAGTMASQCVNCHMPAQTYMVVDARRDHSIRVPRPDLSVTLGTPNACNQCHTDKTAQWASEAVKHWYGHMPTGYQHYQSILHNARLTEPGTEQALLAFLANKQQPAIARATAAQMLGPYIGPSNVQDVALLLKDPSPLVRAGAIQALPALPAIVRWQLVRTLLTDPSRVIRALAASVLTDIPEQEVPADERWALSQANHDYLASLAFNADSATSQVHLGDYYRAKGQFSKAEQAYQQALSLDPGWETAYVNLADLYRAQGLDEKGALLLRSALSRHPDSATINHSYGLLLIRQQHLADALPFLQKAATLNPLNARYIYVYAVALNSLGQRQQALAVVKEGIKTIGQAPQLSQLLLQL
ncbi:tetratricopeptide repeat protein [Gallaecimonas mangrovi]|uniref:tetratricopeptide repeat protein n=1 Tax=Gallaecimonas mangrovi TaxID=2291597 RepID=UPI000E1FEDF2|nr:tetratricopeptide repeat protein [Gallaecimonas mangrovi]